MFRMSFLLILTFICREASAATVIELDFEDEALSASATTADPISIYPYQFGGFVITNSADDLNVYGPANTTNYAGSTALHSTELFSTFEIRRFDDSPFDLLSIDIARLTKGASEANFLMSFTGVKVGGGIPATNAFSFSVGNDEFETLNFIGFTDVTSVTWGQNAPFHQFDNITLQVTAVPEPTSLAFLGVGLGVVGARRMRRKLPENEAA